MGFFTFLEAETIYIVEKSSSSSRGKGGEAGGQNNKI